ncbi:MAG: hypothetical protein JXR76_17445 [Deltaproteobacteria bacterium]|nr:hypothetical protein [Deltaproteobacteria bacterium]
MRRKIAILCIVLIAAIVAIKMFAANEHFDEQQSAKHLSHQKSMRTAKPNDTAKHDYNADARQRGKQLAIALASKTRRDMDMDNAEAADYTDIVDEATQAYQMARDATIRDIFFDELLNTMASIFKQDTLDAARTRFVSNSLEKTLADLDGSTLTSCECTVKICKVTFSHMNQTAYEIFRDGGISASEILNNVTAGGDYEEFEDGGIESIMYFSKKDNAIALNDEIADKMYEMVKKQL